MEKKEYTLELGGRTLTATFNDLADQANGSVLMKYGDTTVLVTTVLNPKPREGMDFFPLVVDYEEKFYAAGLILGGRYIKREGRPSDEAVLAGRMIDRTIRPLFDQNIRKEVQVIATVLSIDNSNDPDILSIIGASLALSTSDIPWNGPIGAIRLGLDEDKNIIINPTYEQREAELLDLLICGRDQKINMIESEAKEVSEDLLDRAFDQAMSEIAKLEKWQKEIISEQGCSKQDLSEPGPSEELVSLFDQKIKPELDQAVFSQNSKSQTGKLKDQWLEIVKNENPEADPSQAGNIFEEAVNDLLHQEAIKNDRRADGRKMNEVRPLYAQAGGISEIIHGSGIFYRGGTHILTVLTLSGPQDSQIIEGMEVRTKKYFMHHYNFPPFSVGETGRISSMNRRSIGHGALAEKSLRAVLPDRHDFPYTIRLVSEALASNGSTSMGSICGSSLALMDGGVPITRPVAGIAMGLMIDENDNYKILTDIQGPEDHHGDMDFKVAGTENGITGLQLDVKVDGINPDILSKALRQAQEARIHILNTISQTLAEPRPELKPTAPKIATVELPKDKIGMVIGPGGKTIQKIIEDTGAAIDIDDEGIASISGPDQAVSEAKAEIESIIREYEAGEEFSGEVVKVLDFGAFVKIGPNTDGLVHISELAPWRVEKVTDLVNEGDKVPVVIKEIDDRGRLSLSIKQIKPNFFKNPESPQN